MNKSLIHKVAAILIVVLLGIIGYELYAIAMGTNFHGIAENKYNAEDLQKKIDYMRTHPETAVQSDSIVTSSTTIPMAGHVVQHQATTTKQ
jgi:hypothetical protein